MEVIYQVIGVVLLTVIVSMTLNAQSKSFACMLVMLVCVMILATAAHFLSPVMDFLQTLAELTGLGGDILSVLFKTLGITVISEIAVLICNDAGQSSLGKALQMATNAAIVWLSLPVFQALLDLLRQIMEAV